MGYHIWTQQCPCCDFEEMIVSTDNNFHFEIACPICGYKSWTEDKLPDFCNVELAKRKLMEMSLKEKEEAIELYHKNNLSLVDRLKQ